VQKGLAEKQLPEAGVLPVHPPVPPPEQVTSRSKQLNPSAHGNSSINTQTTPLKVAVQVTVDRMPQSSSFSAMYAPVALYKVISVSPPNRVPHVENV
jgi:hypothetical protein